MWRAMRVQAQRVRGRFLIPQQPVPTTQGSWEVTLVDPGLELGEGQQ